MRNIFRGKILQNCRFARIIQTLIAIKTNK